MPIYEYQCLECGKHFEYFLRRKDEEVSCPGCEKKNLRKLFSTFAFSSKDASGNISAGSSGCHSCSGGNCSTCGG